VMQRVTARACIAVLRVWAIRLRIVGHVTPSAGPLWYNSVTLIGGEILLLIKLPV